MHGWVHMEQKRPKSVDNEKNVVTRSDFLLNLSVVFLKNNWHLLLLNLK